MLSFATAQLSGNLTADHPSLKAAKAAEDEIASRVHSEIDGAIVGVKTELQVSQQRANLLQSQLTDARLRLSKLADMRAEYANLVAERNQRADILKSAEQQMAEARASSAAAGAASVIAAIDAPVAGDAPVGPGQSDHRSGRIARRIDAWLGNRVPHGATLKIGRGGSDRRSGSKLECQSGSPGRGCCSSSASRSDRRRHLAGKWIVAGARSIFEAGVAKAGGCRLIGIATPDVVQAQGWPSLGFSCSG